MLQLTSRSVRIPNTGTARDKTLAISSYHASRSDIEITGYLKCYIRKKQVVTNTLVIKIFFQAVFYFYSKYISYNSCLKIAFTCENRYGYSGISKMERENIALLFLWHQQTKKQFFNRFLPHTLSIAA